MLDEYPCAMDFSHISGFLHHFVLAKLATSSLRVKNGAKVAIEIMHCNSPVSEDHPLTKTILDVSLLWNLIADLIILCFSLFVTVEIPPAIDVDNGNNMVSKHLIQVQELLSKTSCIFSNLTYF